MRLNRFTQAEGRRARLTRRSLVQGLVASALSLPLLASCQGESTREFVTHTVDMISENGEEIFRPDRIRIEPGDKVRWVLASGFHSATAYHPEIAGKVLRIPGGAEPWDSGLLRTDEESFEAVFPDAGVYCYYCTPHEALGMLGVIVVGSFSNSEPGLAPPQASLPKAAKAKIELFNAWAQNL